VRAAAESGAEVLALCDTNGGMLPARSPTSSRDVVDATGARIGIHCHNDTGCAVANSMAAIDAGATHVQGTINGYGERTGNANSSPSSPTCRSSRADLIEPHRLAEATRISHAISEITNVAPYSRQPYTGSSAFAHKAGLHASAIKVDPDLYQHTDPKRRQRHANAGVGHGRSRLDRAQEPRTRASISTARRGRAAKVARVLATVKDSGAAWLHLRCGGRELRVAAAPGARRRPARLLRRRVVAGHHRQPRRATMRCRRRRSRSLRRASGSCTTGEGNGPVNALDHALRQASRGLSRDRHLELVDYKVRILDTEHGTDAVTRVLIETSDGSTTWSTIGVAANILEASWDALLESVTYGLIRAGVAPR
jgi:2-isopropylmalate synthase